MVFGTLARISLGAAAGVYAEKNGYVDEGVVQFKEQYAMAQQQYNLPALPQFVAVNVKLPEMPTTFPSAEEIQTRVTAALEAARELMSQYLPMPPQPVVEVSAPIDLAMVAPVPAVTSQKGSSMLSTLMWLGFGTGIMVYVLGIEESKKLANDLMNEARTYTLYCAKWLDAQIEAAGLKPYRDVVVKHLSVAAVHAGEVLSHPQVLAAKAATVEFVSETAMPAVKAAVETTIEVSKPYAIATFEVSKPYAIATIEYAKPHVAAAQKLISELIESIMKQLN